MFHHPAEPVYAPHASFRLTGKIQFRYRLGVSQYFHLAPGIGLGFEFGDKGQCAVFISEIQTITHYPNIRDAEAKIVNRYVERVTLLLQ